MEVLYEPVLEAGMGVETGVLNKLISACRRENSCKLYTSLRRVIAVAVKDFFSLRVKSECASRYAAAAEIRECPSFRFTFGVLSAVSAGSRRIYSGLFLQLTGYLSARIKIVVYINAACVCVP